jgi:hypothetical protein
MRKDGIEGGRKWKGKGREEKWGKWKGGEEK